MMAKRLYTLRIARPDIPTHGGNVYRHEALEAVRLQVQKSRKPIVGWMMVEDAEETPGHGAPESASHLVRGLRWAYGWMTADIEPTATEWGRMLRAILDSGATPLGALRCEGRYIPGTTHVDPQDLRLVSVDVLIGASAMATATRRLAQETRESAMGDDGNGG